MTNPREGLGSHPANTRDGLDTLIWTMFDDPCREHGTDSRERVEFRLTGGIEIDRKFQRRDGVRVHPSDHHTVYDPVATVGVDDVRHTTGLRVAQKRAIDLQGPPARHRRGNRPAIRGDAEHGEDGTDENERCSRSGIRWLHVPEP